MAKLSFTKLGLAQNKAVKCINYNGQSIEIKQYLPIGEKLELITNVMNSATDDNNFVNPIKISILTVIHVVDMYTNINFTDKQKEDPCKLYDLLVGNGLSTMIMSAIPAEELMEVLTGVEDSVKAIYDYRNSVLGILDTILTDYSDLKFDAATIQEKLADPQNLEFLKSVMAKLG